MIKGALLLSKQCPLAFESFRTLKGQQRVAGEHLTGSHAFQYFNLDIDRMDVSVLEIRPLATPDATAFRRIRLQAISDSPSAVWPTYEEEARRTDQEIEARIQRTGTQVVFGAFLDTKLVGIAGLRRESLDQVKHKAILWGVFISPDRRREGLARKLFATVLSFARDAGILQIQLSVNAENDRARSLYRSLGFKSYGLEPRAMRVGDRYFDEEHMVLRLDD